MSFSQHTSEFDRLQTNFNNFQEDSEDDEESPPSYQQGGEAWFPAGGGGARPKGPGLDLGSSPNHRKTPTGQNHPAVDNGVILHMVPESGKSRWSHIEDLDSFFKKVYEYHQRHGFKVMILQKFCELAQVFFVILLTVYLCDCVNYQVLFTNKVPGHSLGEKVHLSDVFETSPTECIAKFSFKIWVFIFVAMSLWLWKAVAVGYCVFQYWDIKSFYNQALKISDEDLDSVSWHEVQKRLIGAQSEHLMCIHKDHLTELDIYHRILRFKNYLVAMVNKGLLPMRLSVPFVGDSIFLSQGLRWNYEFLLFSGPWAPFDKWHLKEDYKKSSKRKELTSYLQSKIALVALLNLVLMPLILFWQILYSFFNYAELIKREPGHLGVRKWSQYGKLYMRHFNELDHELKARLSRAYKPANQYMDIFVSPTAAVLARFVCFVAGSVLAVLIVLTVWDEDVLNVEHILTIMTVLGGVIAGASLFIPDPNMVFNPERCLSAVLAHIHYFPPSPSDKERPLTLGPHPANGGVGWKGREHTPAVMESLGELFPYTAVYLLQELISPIVTPFVLFFSLRPKAGSIVDFFRNFTVDIVGVGDVCSFAQMDVRKHGNPAWAANAPPPPQSPDEERDESPPPTAEVPQPYAQAQDGKTEMSLVHFSLTHPGWVPPQPESETFVQNLRGQAAREAEQLTTLTEEELAEGTNALHSSLNSLDAAGGVYSEIANSIILASNSQRVVNGGLVQQQQQPGLTESGRRVARSPQEAAPETSGSLLQSIHQGLGVTGGTGSSSIKSSILLGSRITDSRGSPAHAVSSQLGASIFGQNGGCNVPNLKQDLRRLGLDHHTTSAAADMSLSALYLHELHHRSCQPPVASGSASNSGLRNRLRTPPAQQVASFREEEEEDTQPLVQVDDQRV